MRNTQSRKKLTLEQRVARMYNRLPKRLKVLETREEKKQTIRAIAQQWKLGYLKTKEGRQISIRRVLRSSLERRQPRRTQTKRDLFRRFRIEDSSLFAKYNSYMFRHGYRSTDYYMQNATISYLKGSIVEASLTLPDDTEGLARIRKQNVQYTKLTLTYDYSGELFYAELS